MRKDSGSRQPETLRQARRFDRVAGLAVEYGELCWACASQLGWSGQLGFLAVKSPCEDCAPVVATFPVARPNGWRVILGRLDDPRGWSAWSAGRDLMTARRGDGVPRAEMAEVARRSAHRIGEGGL